MYVVDIYSVKQPQNIIVKIKMKEHETGKKNTGKRLNGSVLFSLFCLWDSYLSALFTSGKAAQLTSYEFSTYLHQLQPPSLVWRLLGECLW